MISLLLALQIVTPASRACPATELIPSDTIPERRDHTLPHIAAAFEIIRVDAKPSFVTGTTQPGGGVDTVALRMVNYLAVTRHRWTGPRVDTMKLWLLADTLASPLQPGDRILALVWPVVVSHPGSPEPPKNYVWQLPYCPIRWDEGRTPAWLAWANSKWKRHMWVPPR